MAGSEAHATSAVVVPKGEIAPAAARNSPAADTPQGTADPDPAHGPSEGPSTKSTADVSPADVDSSASGKKASEASRGDLEGSPLVHPEKRLKLSEDPALPSAGDGGGAPAQDGATEATQAPGERGPGDAGGRKGVVDGAVKQEEEAGAEAELRVKKLSEIATLPTRGSDGAAGYDLSSAEDTVVPARGKAIVKTDLSIAIPKGTYARIAPRSGLAAKHSIDIGAGVVDYDYRGNVGVILFNFSDTDFKVNVGDRIAQLILERIVTPRVREVEDLDVTGRGAGGFGSTGVAANASSH